MVSVWPNMNQGTADYEEFAAAGKLLHDLSTYDAFDPEARAMYWRQAKAELFDGGFDAWWCDSTEPFSGPDWGGEVRREPWERFKLVGDEHKRFLDPARANLYALVHAQGIYENQRQDAPGKRVLNLTRSGWVSSQRYGAVLWSGVVRGHLRPLGGDEGADSRGPVHVRQRLSLVDAGHRRLLRGAGQLAGPGLRL